MKKIFIILIICICIVGCNKKNSYNESEKEKNKIVNYLEEIYSNDVVKVYSNVADLSVTYNSKQGYLKENLANNNFTIKEFISTLDLIKKKEDGARLYVSNKNVEDGLTFYLAECFINNDSYVLIGDSEKVFENCQIND